MDLETDRVEYKVSRSAFVLPRHLFSKYFRSLCKNTYAYMYECVGCIHPGIMVKSLFNSTNRLKEQNLIVSRYNQTLAHDRFGSNILKSTVQLQQWWLKMGS